MKMRSRLGESGASSIAALRVLLLILLLLLLLLILLLLLLLLIIIGGAHIAPDAACGATYWLLSQRVSRSFKTSNQIIDYGTSQWFSEGIKQTENRIFMRIYI